MVALARTGQSVPTAQPAQTAPTIRTAPSTGLAVTKRWGAWAGAVVDAAGTPIGGSAVRRANSVP